MALEECGGRYDFVARAERGMPAMQLSPGQEGGRLWARRLRSPRQYASAPAVALGSAIEQGSRFSYSAMSAHIAPNAAAMIEFERR